MYRNINNYYFNRPNYGYAYANPYGMNFSRSYPRVVIYDGQQNFNKVTDFLKKHGRKAALAGALLAAGSPAAQDIGKDVGELVRVPQTYTITQPVYEEPATLWDGTPSKGEEVVKYETTRPDGRISQSRQYYKDRNGKVSLVVSQGQRAPYMRDDIARLKKHHWPNADFLPAYGQYKDAVADDYEQGWLTYR